MNTIQMQTTARFCGAQGIRWQERLIMAEYTTFRIGGPVSAAFPENVSAMQALMAFCHEKEIPYFFVGNGSNLLVSDRGSEKLMIFTEGLSSVRRWGETGIEAECGLSLARLAREAMQAELTGLEFAGGIPGTVGAGICMNCGAYGGEMKQVAVRVEYIDEQGEIGAFEGEKLRFRYRGSRFTDDPSLCVLRAYFQLKPGKFEEINAKGAEFAARRTEKQPLNYPSAGSVFKRPEGFFAGKLIEDCGLKGARIGGAQVSEKHAGFIINTGGATCTDVRRLIEHIQKTVYKAFGVMLECEIRMVD